TYALPDPITRRAPHRHEIITFVLRLGDVAGSCENSNGAPSGAPLLVVHLVGGQAPTGWLSFDRSFCVDTT
ncbi:MAG TPA: hypothetical protein VFY79_13565, partial [Dehalococcoidia bacterium]|nr:hypothetical protein [Dehalococcoidia bacterium]